MRVLSIILIYMLNACVTRIFVEPKQQCAQQKMALEGLRLESGSAVTHGPEWRTYTTDVASSSVQCVVPKSEKEKCEVNIFDRSLEPIGQFNRNLAGKNLIIGLGYCALILPGVWAYLHYRGEREEAVVQSRQIIETGLPPCENAGGVSSKPST